MIVISTFNGKIHLERLLNELNSLNLFHHSVLIVDSGTNDTESIDYLNYLNGSLNNFNFKLSLDKTNLPNYDSGVISHVINNYNEESYIFIHDSSSIKNEECLLKIDELLNNNEMSVVPFLIFIENDWPSEEQKEFTNRYYGSKNNNYGIFASMFAINKKTVEKVKSYNLTLPKNKEESRAMERCWSIVFETLGINVIPLEGHYNHDNIINDTYRYFRKILAGRI